MKRKRSKSSSAPAQQRGPKRICTPGAVFVSTSNFLAASASQAPLSLGPYTNRQTILVVGDGNLSFSSALAASLGGDHLVATVYDRERVFRSKYPSANHLPEKLRTLNAEVLFGIDATCLHTNEKLRKRTFHRIVFNFPHTGAGSAEGNVEQNQELLLLFFQSARKLLRDRGEIHVSLRTTTFYQSVQQQIQRSGFKPQLDLTNEMQWDIVGLAQQSLLTLHKTLPFRANLFAGYENCRTLSEELVRQAPSTEGAKIFCFVYTDEARRQGAAEDAIEIDDEAEGSGVVGARERVKTSEQSAKEEKRGPQAVVAPESVQKEQISARACQFHCEVCDVTMPDKITMHMHCRTDSHMENARNKR